MKKLTSVFFCLAVCFILNGCSAEYHEDKETHTLVFDDIAWVESHSDFIMDKYHAKRPARRIDFISYVIFQNKNGEIKPVEFSYHDWKFDRSDCSVCKLKRIPDYNITIKENASNTATITFHKDLKIVRGDYDQCYFWTSVDIEISKDKYHIFKKARRKIDE